MDFPIFVLFIIGVIVGIILILFKLSKNNLRPKEPDWLIRSTPPRENRDDVFNINKEEKENINNVENNNGEEKTEEDTDNNNEETEENETDSNENDDEETEENESDSDDEEETEENESDSDDEDDNEIEVEKIITIGNHSFVEIELETGFGEEIAKSVLLALKKFEDENPNLEVTHWRFERSRVQSSYLWRNGIWIDHKPKPEKINS